MSSLTPTPPVTTKAPVVELVDAVPDVTEVSPLNVVAPVTPNVPPIVELPVALKVVNAPVDAEFAPMAVPSIAPAFISTLD